MNKVQKLRDSFRYLQSALLRHIDKLWTDEYRKQYFDARLVVVNRDITLLVLNTQTP